MEKKLVTYILPLWEKTNSIELENSLRSLLPEYHLIEDILLVYDGYNSFGLHFRVPELIENKLTRIYCPINKGPGLARNTGALYAKTEFIFFLDAGALSRPD